MEFVSDYPKLSESWYRVLAESVRIWWIRRRIKKFVENELLID
jgi:hypothetical protein